MEKRLYTAQRPEYAPDRNGDRSDPSAHVADVALWRSDVFDDSIPKVLQVAYLREYCLTLRSNLDETSKDLERVISAIKKLKK